MAKIGNDREKGCIDLSKAGELGEAYAYKVIKEYCVSEYCVSKK